MVARNQALPPMYDLAAWTRPKTQSFWAAQCLIDSFSLESKSFQIKSSQNFIPTGTPSNFSKSDSLLSQLKLPASGLG
jgi:hypothetical protein